MKSIFKVMLPVLAFVFAGAAAVKTNEAKQKSEKESASVKAFIHNTTQFNCLEVSENCVIENTDVLCMTSEKTPKQVWRKNTAGECNIELYRVLK